MKEKDLIEFLRSTIEEDAVISRLFTLFHKKYGYSLLELICLIKYGVKNRFFIIEDINTDKALSIEDINWISNNIYQEVIMMNPDRFIPFLFSVRSRVPNEFKQFIDII